ncbi:MAE_28990/MAE_18760 family HEPN-like nuclease [Frigoribacterium sp. Leaf164]|uniref:MAE_28990/MAE_18760 family HEPN-like nuclease n=1 Tax=Frigoribacterium sp. Leaf164 TaxID=1736282 RepID=UPI0012E21E21|nr:MAE_28990/MAE_18760 family HEPN-like nuclease [Frigoribacterium sp. Leaf164]
MALEIFSDGTTEVDLLRELAVAAEQREAEANALCRAAVVLLVSHFESFLKTIAEEYVDAVGTGDVESSRLPRGLREAHTLPRLESIVTSRDEDQRTALLKKIGSIAALWNDDAKPPKGALSASTFARLVTSAKADIINDLFARMGNSAGVCDGDIEVPGNNGDVVTANIELSLRDVVTCRNDIAHGKADRKPTPDDVRRYLDFLRTFAERLQRKALVLSAAVVQRD